MLRGIKLCALAALMALAALFAACGKEPSPSSPPEGSYFEAHFLSVGEGDAALIICDGHAMLIDGGEPKYSDLIYAYLKEHSVSSLDLIVATHPHADHIGGLSAALSAYPAGEVWCPVASWGSKAFASFMKYAELRGLHPRRPAVGECFSLGSALVRVLAPIAVTDDMNNSSIVLRIEYGQTSFLFTGDMEREEELSLLETQAELSSTVLKVGHHGSGNATCYPFLREVSPTIAVISVGTPNPYSHPHESVLSRLRDAGARVYRTDLQGHIVITSDGERVTVAPTRNENADTLTPGFTAGPK